MESVQVDTATATNPLEPHTVRRRRATRARLAEAGMKVFRERGYDAATTGEVARIAGVAAGTFYVHFRDKRALYEHLAADTARELLERWHGAFTPKMDSGDRAVIALEITAEYWRADLARARLLLDGGPALGNESHLHFVDEVARSLAAANHTTSDTPPRPLALLIVGLGIELGRLIAVRPGAEAEVEDLIRLVRKAYQS